MTNANLEGIVHEDTIPSGTSNVRPAVNLAEAMGPIRESARERDRAGGGDRTTISQLKDLGFTRLRLPRSEGGEGKSVGELIDLVITLATADSAIAHALRSHFGFVEQVLLSPTTPTLNRWLGRIAAGDTFASAVSEVGGLRPLEVDTVLVPNFTGYTVDADKYYTTGSLYADWIYLVAKDEHGDTRMATINADRPGVEVLDDFDGIGQRASSSGSVRFRKVLVAKSELDRPEDFSERSRWYRGSFGQLYLAAVLVGIAHAALDDAERYVLGRARVATHAQADLPRDDPFVQSTVGTISAYAAVARAGVLAAAEELDRTFAAVLADDASVDDTLTAAAIEVTKAHTVASRLALDAAELLMTTGSGSAVSRTQNLDRHWRNARTVSNHSPMDHKSRVIGDYILNGTPPPSNGYF